MGKILVAHRPTTVGLCTSLGRCPAHHLDTGEEGPSVSWLDGYAASKNKQEPTLDYWALVLLIHRYTQGECNPLKVEWLKRPCEPSRRFGSLGFGHCLVSARSLEKVSTNMGKSQFCWIFLVTGRDLHWRFSGCIPTLKDRTGKSYRKRVVYWTCSIFAGITI